MPPHRLRHMESQNPSPPGHNHKEKEASRHRPLHIRGRGRRDSNDSRSGKVPVKAPHIPPSPGNRRLNRCGGSPTGRSVRERLHQAHKGPVGRATILLLPRRTSSHDSTGGIPAGMAGKQRHLRTSSMGIPIPRGKRTIGASCSIDL